MNELKPSFYINRKTTIKSFYLEKTLNSKLTKFNYVKAGKSKIFRYCHFINKMPRVRVKLNSTDIGMLNDICNSISDLAKKSGILIRGPVTLPTQRLKITTRKSPCGDGTATFDRFEMRIHKRLIDLPANEKVLHNIMRLQIPKSVNIKIEVKD